MTETENLRDQIDILQEALQDARKTCERQQGVIDRLLIQQGNSQSVVEAVVSNALVQDREFVVAKNAAIMESISLLKQMLPSLIDSLVTEPESEIPAAKSRTTKPHKE